MTSDPSPAAPTHQLDIHAVARDTAYDRYIQAALVRPTSLRADFMTLAAFHGELSRIPVLVGEPMMGEIRLQWWHDTLSATAYISDGDTPPDLGSPLASRVAELIARFPVMREPFLFAIDARRAELDAGALTEQDAFERYLDGVGVGTFRAAARLLELPEDDLHHNAIEYAGRAVATLELAQKLALLRARGRHFEIPDLRHDEAKQKSPGTVIAIEACMQSLSATATRAVAAYRALQGRGSPKLIAATLPIALVVPSFKVLKQIQQKNEMMRHPLTPMGRLLRLWWAARRGHI